MRKTITTAIAMALFTTLSGTSAEAQGLRIGFSQGGVYTPNVGGRTINDPSILEGARRRQEMNNARRQGSQHAVPAPSKADRAAERRRAAQEAAAAKAKARQEAAAAAKAQAAATAAAAAASKSAVATAQEAQRAKADEMLRRLATPSTPTSPVTTKSPAPVATPVAPSKPVETAAPVQAPTPSPSRVVQAPRPAPLPPVSPAAAPAQSSKETAAQPAGDCRRFIPGAGITVRVPCSE